MTEKYGNLPLGQVYKLLVSIIGRDAALTIAKRQKLISEDKVFANVFESRMFEENDISFVRLRPSDKTGPMELIRIFFQFEKLQINEKKLLIDKSKKPPVENGKESSTSELGPYELPSHVGLLVNPFFFGVYRDALRALTPYEMQLKDIALLLLNWFLGYLGANLQDSDNQEIYTISKDSVNELLNDTEETIRETIMKITINKDDFSKKLKCFYEEKTWNTLKPLLDALKSIKERVLINRLIGFYLLKNTEAALVNVCGIEQEDIEKVKNDIRKWANNKLPSNPQSESQCFLMTTGKYDPSDLSILQRDFIDPDYQEQINAIQECHTYLRGKSTINHDRAKQLIQTMEKECPNCGIFFASWEKARLAVLSLKFNGSEEDERLKKEALESYHEAFDKGRNFAGAYLRAFLKESIAATVYFNRRRIQDIPKVIDIDKSLKTPITDDVKEKENREASYGAKQYYEYGYALNLFEQESSETYLLHFNAEEHFWKVFPPHQFINTDAVSKKASEDLLRAKGTYPIEGGKEELEQYIETLKQKLEKVSEKTINRKMEKQPGHNIQYTPLSIALQMCELDIAEHYLKDFANSLDVTVINTHGSTALLEALTQYKNHRFFKWDEQNTERYKKIIMELINRSPVVSLYAETVKRHISVLEEAINTFDIDIVRAIVEKKGFNMQDIKISADELSSLYYAIMRCSFLSDTISNGGLQIPNNPNMNWSKANFPGIFTEDKMAYYNKIKSDTLINNKEMESLNIYIFLGKPEIWEQEFKELKEIIKYLIEKTNDVNKFAKETPTGERTTALDLAVESDFDDICRLLIKKGADPARISGKNGMPYDSPFIRAAWFKSWKTFEMLLTDYIEKIKSIVNESYRESMHTAAHLLFKVDYGPLCQYSVNYENFKHIERFIPLLRSAGAEFDIPNSGGKTVRQILRENRIEKILI